MTTLRKLAHAIYRDFSSCKNHENFCRKVFTFFFIFAQNIDCGYALEPPRRGGSNEYPKSMFWSKNKKNSFLILYTGLCPYQQVVKFLYVTKDILTFKQNTYRL